MRRLLPFCLLASCLWGQTGRFEKLATYKGLGALVASSVGPGPADGSQRFYLSYLYVDHTIDVVAVDPDTGESRVFENPAPTESGARCMVLGPNDKLYLGTLPYAHFLELDPKAGTLRDLGRPSDTEQYIWDVAFGSDGKLYGATYPQSKLVRYDPNTQDLEDLGRMDPQEQYAHYVAGNNDGFVYVGIGTSKANIAAYEIATGQHREILPPEFQTVGQAHVYRALDGNVYGNLGSRYFRLKGWTCTSIPPSQAVAAVPNNRLADSRTVSADGRTLRVFDLKTSKTTERPFEYAGNELSVFRVGFGPDGVLYGSSVLPIHLLRLDSENGTLPELGDFGGGEFYSFLSHGKWLVGAAYSALSPLMAYDPAKPFDLAGTEKNPRQVNFPGSDSGWRPQALIEGPDGRVYVGAVSGYGKLGGGLTVWNVETGAVEDHQQLIKDQSVITLARWKNLIVGGTTTGGGGGSHPTQTQAKIFLWDPESGQKLFETVPVSTAKSINDLITAPNGLVYGFAGRTLFSFNPESREVKILQTVSFSGIYNSVAVGPKGKIWGLATTGIFSIDPENDHAELVATSPKPITAGFDLRDSAIYFGSGPEVWRWSVSPE